MFISLYLSVYECESRFFEFLSQNVSVCFSLSLVLNVFEDFEELCLSACGSVGVFDNFFISVCMSLFLCL